MKPRASAAAILPAPRKPMVNGVAMKAFYQADSRSGS
jgi:hypothetical protein